MNKKLNLAVAAALALGASAAQAGITIPAGDWTIDIGGNVNAYYTNTNFDGVLDSDVDGAPGSASANNISTGLLPAAIGIGGKTRQNDLDIAFQFTFFTGVDSEDTSTGGATVGNYGANGAGGNTVNVRQAFLTFGDKSWGTIKMGRDLGIFGSDAILSDMTLLGVGNSAGGSGNSTLGRIGTGYLYADWVGQIQYASPNWNGFSFAVAARQPWGNSANEDLGFDAKASYEWAGDVSGKVWVGGIHQKTQNAESAATTAVNLVTGAVEAVAAVDNNEETASAWEIGAKVNVGGFGLVGYYYDGKGFGSPLLAGPSLNVAGLLINNADNDVDGGYVQGTYTLPMGTKIGLSWGESNIDVRGQSNEFTAEAWVAGVYHPLTKSLNLVAEYTSTDYENIRNATTGAVIGDGEADTIALGAILFF